MILWLYKIPSYIFTASTTNYSHLSVRPLGLAKAEIFIDNKSCISCRLLLYLIGSRVFWLALSGKRESSFHKLLRCSKINRNERKVHFTYKALRMTEPLWPKRPPGWEQGASPAGEGCFVVKPALFTGFFLLLFFPQITERNRLLSGAWDSTAQSAGCQSWTPQAPSSLPSAQPITGAPVGSRHKSQNPRLV